MQIDPTVVLELIHGFRASKIMFCALELGVFDRLAAAPAAAGPLASELGVDGGALERLLSACAGIGLLERRGEHYHNQPVASAYLARESPQSLAGYILYSGRALYRLWGNLDDAVREGGNRWRQTFGLDGPLFSSFFRTPEALAEFTRGMHGLGLLSSDAVVGAFDLSGFRHLADLGGATGHLAIAACRRYPGLAATVLELPAVAAFAREYLAGSGLAGRITIREGDFFAGPLPPADLYALGRVLHDWDEERIRLLLGRIHEALPEGGGLLVAEKLLDEDRCGPPGALLQDLNMLVCAEGRERSASEYRELLRSCGFGRVEARRTGAYLDAVLAIKTGACPEGGSAPE
jgi:acetylserotonin N-methyltransferase